MVTVDDVRRVALSLPRTEEKLIADRVKFRVGRLVYVAFSRDETVMGFAFPKEERAALIAAEPGRFHLPRPSDERYNWVHAWTAAIGETEMREVVIDAWRMVVPKGLAAAHLDAPGSLRASSPGSLRGGSRGGNGGGAGDGNGGGR